MVKVLELAAEAAEIVATAIVRKSHIFWDGYAMLVLYVMVLI